MKEHFHLYDQGLFSEISQGSDLLVKNFVDSASEILKIDLYSPSYKLAPTSATFIEAIGYSECNKWIRISTNITKEDVLSLTTETVEPYNIQYEDDMISFLNENDFTNLIKIVWLSYYPAVIKERAYQALLIHPSLQPAALIDRTIEQLKYCNNRIAHDLISGILKENLDLLHADPISFQHEVCFYLAAEYAQYFDYISNLPSDISDSSQKKSIASLIHYSLIKEASAHYASASPKNYIRSLDSGYKFLESLGLNKNESSNAYLENGKDLLDSEIIHYALFGYQGYPVHIFTCDIPATINNRLDRALQLLNEIKKTTNDSHKFNPGFIYFCHINTLQINEQSTIDVSIKIGK